MSLWENMTMWEWKAHRTLHDIEWCIQLGSQEMRDFTYDVRLIRAFCLSLSLVSYYDSLYIWVSVLAFIKIKQNFINSMIAGNNEETPKKNAYPWVSLLLSFLLPSY